MILVFLDYFDVFILKIKKINFILKYFEVKHTLILFFFGCNSKNTPVFSQWYRAMANKYRMLLTKKKC
jgi:hypothetical protein